MVGKVLSDAWWLYRIYLVRIGLLAVVILGGAELLAYAVDVGSADVRTPADLLRKLPLLTALAGSALLAAFAEPLFAGLLEKTLDPVLEHRPMPTLRQVLGTTPYLRLLATALLLAVIVEVGLVLFLVPGFVALTLLGLAVPLVVAEELGPLRALRRSSHLLSRHLWEAVLLVMAPVVATALLWEALDGALHALPIWADLPIVLVFSLTLPTYFGVVLSALTIRLIHQHPQRAADP
ncbi:MAG: hypothetical protein J2P45_30335 [Candidatus Dormibacteraeota bacterium]|nr:hypothetical protein [Candidatus Dormibacteraeota bacterium]